MTRGSGATVFKPSNRRESRERLDSKAGIEREWPDRADLDFLRAWVLGVKKVIRRIAGKHVKWGQWYMCLCSRFLA